MPLKASFESTGVGSSFCYVALKRGWSCVRQRLNVQLTNCFVTQVKNSQRIFIKQRSIWMSLVVWSVSDLIRLPKLSYVHGQNVVLKWDRIPPAKRWGLRFTSLSKGLTIRRECTTKWPTMFSTVEQHHACFCNSNWKPVARESKVFGWLLMPVPPPLSTYHAALAS